MACAGAACSPSAQHAPKRVYEYYTCGGTDNRGNIPDHPPYNVRADVVLDAILEKVMAELTDAQIAYFCKRVEEAYRTRFAGKANRETEIKRQINKLREKYETLRQNMLYAASPEAVAEFSKELSRVRDEQQLAEVELKGLDRLGGAAEAGVAEVVNACRDTLLDYRRRLTDPDAQKDVIHAVLDSAAVHTTREKRGERAKVSIEKIDVVMRYSGSILQNGYLWQLPV